ncbi:hypothetical protein T492DRAFT_593757, partial [Pavlovales sp. CCMP2436]
MISSCPCAPGYTPEYAVDVGGNTYDTEVCLPCETGSYKAQAIDSACKLCPNSGQTVDTATTSASECTCLYGAFANVYDSLGTLLATGCLCDQGEFLLNGANPTCEPCPLGYYKEVKGNQECTLCPQGLGSQTTTVGSITADSCACDTDPAFGGNFSLDASSGNYCEPCKGGTYKSVAGDGSCSACPTNSDEAVEGLTSLSATVCAKCAMATYKGETSNSACDACPSGMSTASTGSTKITDCICPVSQYMKIDGEVRSCIDCPTG